MYMQHLRDVTRWSRPHDAKIKSKPVDIHLTVYERYGPCLYDRISLYKVPRTTKLVKQSLFDSSNVQTRDVTRVLQSDWSAKILAHGSKTVYIYRR